MGSCAGYCAIGTDEKGDAALAPESPFGMGVYLNRYGGDAGGLALMERAAQMARDAGVKWSREDFSWGRIERQRGQFDWTYYDNLVACARRNGISVYAIVGYWTGWTKPYTKEGIEDYVQFLKVMVRRYQKEIKQWEIWNEPNIFFWQGPKDMYAELLTRAERLSLKFYLLSCRAAGFEPCAGDFVRRSPVRVLPALASVSAATGVCSLISGRPPAIRGTGLERRSRWRKVNTLPVTKLRLLGDNLVTTTTESNFLFCRAAGFDAARVIHDQRGNARKTDGQRACAFTA